MQVFVMTSRRSTGDLVEWSLSEDVMTELYKDNCRNPDYNDAHLALYALDVKSNDVEVIDVQVKAAVVNPFVQPLCSRSPTDIYA